MRTARTAKPHIVLISLCSVRADHLGCYRYPRCTSPAMDAFAGRAVLFEHAVTPWPKTTPSFCSVLTGLYPHETGVTRTTVNQRLADGVDTLAERLKSVGYHTAAFVSSPSASKAANVAQGFDVYAETFRSPEPAEATVASGLAWLEQHCDGPCLLWLHFNDAHYPYKPAERFSDLFVDDEHYDATRRVRLNKRDLPIAVPAGHPASRPVRRPDLGGVHRLAILGDRPTEHAFYVARYDAAIRTADAQVGRALDGLGRVLGDAPRIVAVWSDHGESLGEHNYFFEHGRFAYQACTRVPFMLRYVQRWPTGRRVCQPVSTVDLAATILDLVGGPREGLSGVSLVGVIEGRAQRGDVFFCGGYQPDFITGIRRGRYELLHVPNPIDRQLMHGRRYELYDLEADPQETRNLADLQPELLADLTAALDAWTRPWWRRVVAQAAPPPAEYDREVRQKLKALGYFAD